VEKEKISSGNIIDFSVLKRLLKFVAPYQWRCYLVVFLTFALGILSPLRPMLTQMTLDNDVSVGNYERMVNMMLIMLVMLVVQSIFQYIHTYISGWLGQQVIRDIRMKLYLIMPLPFRRRKF